MKFVLRENQIALILQEKIVIIENKYLTLVFFKFAFC